MGKIFPWYQTDQGFKITMKDYHLNDLNKSRFLNSMPYEDYAPSQIESRLDNELWVTGCKLTWYKKDLIRAAHRLALLEFCFHCVRIQGFPCWEGPMEENQHLADSCSPLGMHAAVLAQPPPWATRCLCTHAQ